MRLLIDAGNSRLKWRLEESGQIFDQGVGVTADVDPLPGFSAAEGRVSRVAVSTVASESKRVSLFKHLSSRFDAPVTFYWAEAVRGGLKSAYKDCSQMGADRWHAMYGAWQRRNQAFLVVDAGSAITVDYVDSEGRHLGGFILPGLNMMRRSLQVDAARIDFDPSQVLNTSPGVSTSECVNHGIAWLSEALVERVRRDCIALGISDILVTGGDAERLLQLGLVAEFRPSLVMDGLGLIDAEAHAE